MIDLTLLPLPLVVAVFLAAAAVVLAIGVRLTRLADRLADVSGLGEAITGAIFLGAITSLSGSVTSVTAAAQGHAQLAVSNAVGGIAAQTVFLVVADVVYRRVNLEHAAASLTNIVSGCLMIILLSLVLVANAAPAVTWFGIHPVTPVLLAVYVGGLRMAASARSDPMWGPEQTAETRRDVPDEPIGEVRSVVRLVALVLGFGAVVGVAGFVIAESGFAIARLSGLREGIVGALMTSVATSTPELVTTIAAVRRGALTLAVGGILGGNTFDVLFTAFSDVAYRPGSIYHAMAPDQVFLVVLAIVMTATLLLGLVHRQPYGFANIGFESLALIVLYGGGMVLLVTGF